MVKADIFIDNTVYRPFLLHKAWYHVISLYDFLFFAIPNDPWIIQVYYPTTGLIKG